MATKVIEEIRYCEKCGMETMQRKNVQQISWLMHLVLTIFTAGLWLFVFIFVLLARMFDGIGNMFNKWHCVNCMNEAKSKKLFDGK